ncbi:MoaB/Mog domain-containing protein [Schizophyllum fasciatum]
MHTPPSALRRVVPVIARIGRPQRHCFRRECARPRLYTTSPSTSNSVPFSVPPKPPTEPLFPISPIPQNPLGEGRCVREAAALVIGDEILNGKTLDRNSNYLARYCFEHGVDLKRIEVIPDDEAEIIEASRRLTDRYDFVVTSGGIGLTSLDITYASLAKAFGQQLQHHPETMRRMDAINAFRNTNLHTSPEQRQAYLRMALFPSEAEVIFVRPEIWVPVVRLAGRLYILPGIPALFQKMLDALTPFLPLPEASERLQRVQIFTDRRESSIAPYLTELQARLRPRGVSVGSYPVVGKGVFISLIGRDAPVSPPAPLTGLGAIKDGFGGVAGVGGKTAGEEASDSSGVGPSSVAAADIPLGKIAEEVEQAVGGRIIDEEEVESVKQVSG